MKKPAQETRQHILDVAKALMTQKGYTAVGLAEVVAALNRELEVPGPAAWGIDAAR